MEISPESYFGNPDDIGYTSILCSAEGAAAAAPSSEKTPLVEGSSAPDVEMGISLHPRRTLVTVSKLSALDDVVSRVANTVDLLVDHRKYFAPHESSYQYQIAYEVENEVLYICAAKQDFSARILFGFLEALKTLWVQNHGLDAPRLKQSKFIKFQQEVEPLIREQMEYFSANPGADKIRKLQAKVDLTVDIMSGNLELLLQRDEQLRALANKSEDLQGRSDAFRTTADAVGLLACCQNLKMTICLAATIICAILALVITGVVLYFFIPLFSGGGKG